MATATKRKTSLSIDATLLDSAKALGLNVSAVSEAALEREVKLARNAAWVAENAEAFAAQSKWHEEHGHPAAEIMMSPGRDTWKD